MSRLGKRSLIYYLTLTILSSVTLSCGIYSRYTYSTPAVDPGTRAFVKNGTVVLEDIELWLVAQNSTGWAVLVPVPIPIPSFGPKSPFRLIIQLTPVRPGFSFDPRELFVVDHSEHRIRPDRVGGGAELRQHGKLTKVVGRISPSPLKAFVLSENIKTQVTLEFDIKPPDPKEIWFLEIEGLSLNDEKYPVPRIRFEPAFYSGPSR